MINNKIRVLIVDDSAMVRQTLSSLINSDPMLEVCGVASDPYNAVKIIRRVVPDIITLDLQMPRMDGLTFLKKLMAQHPIPVVVISSYASKGSVSAIKAFEYGAVEVIAKPKMNTKEFINESKILLCDAIKAAALSKSTKKPAPALMDAKPKYSADVIIEKGIKGKPIPVTGKIVAIGASTGGTTAIAEILNALSPDVPGIVIVQHMPGHFTKLFADRVNSISTISVKEAVSGDIVQKGTALIAPGNKHVLLKRKARKYYIEIIDGPLVNRHRPSVDVLFRSVAINAGKNAIGILLTGMGDDGAKGLLEMKENGAYTIAQDEESCVVFGMPRKAIMLNATEKVCDPKQISAYINNLK